MLANESGSLSKCTFGSFSQELGFEEGQSVLLLERFSTVSAVLAACSDAAKGRSTMCFRIHL